MAMENQQIFALTKMDFVFKIVPHLSIYSCLGSIPGLVKVAPSHQLAARAKLYCNTTASQIQKEATIHLGAANASRRIDSESGHNPECKAQRHAQPPPGNMLGRWGMITSHVVLFLWELTILVLHLLATKTSQSLYVPACKQPIRPWFATKYSCSVMNFNCYRNGSTGVSEDAFDFLEESSLVALVISHCPQLTVPKSVRRLRNLLGTAIYNSTIVEWSADAAITKIDHPSLTYIIFVRSNMAELPPGVLQALPATMADFEISVSNLISLPDDLHGRRHAMTLFYVKHTLISEFPNSLRELSVDDLSLVGNTIEGIPEFAKHHTPNSSRSHCRTTHPRRSPRASATRATWASSASRRRRSLPKWMDSVWKSATNIYAYDTPFCLGLPKDERERKYGPGAVLTCSDSNPRSAGKYPLAVMAFKQPL